MFDSAVVTAAAKTVLDRRLDGGDADDARRRADCAHPYHRPGDRPRRGARRERAELPAGGATAHYFRGDKSWQTLNATSVGLSNVHERGAAAQRCHPDRTRGAQHTAGLVEQTETDAFAKRALGIGATTSVPTRADADARYAALAHTHAQANVTNLATDLLLKAPLVRRPLRAIPRHRTPATADSDTSIATTALLKRRAMPRARTHMRRVMSRT